MNRYLVVYEKTNSGYSAFVPDLPGCVATAETKDEIEVSIYETIKFHLEGLRIENSSIPEGTAEGEILVFQ